MTTKNILTMRKEHRREGGEIPEGGTVMPSG